MVENNYNFEEGKDIFEFIKLLHKKSEHQIQNYYF